AALDAGVITAAERALLLRRDELRNKVIRVDDFPMDFGPERKVEAPRQRAAA
ncbi:MAG: hypothetical protein H6R11_2436, partial [Proteobacteria bacterium]|nr:hypothetical protein [Pseudomonadota bacterium]